MMCSIMLKSIVEKPSVAILDSIGNGLSEKLYYTFLGISRTRENILLINFEKKRSGFKH